MPSQTPTNLTIAAHAAALRRELLVTLRARTITPAHDRRQRDALRRRVDELADELRRLKDSCDD